MFYFFIKCLWFWLEVNQHENDDSYMCVFVVFCCLGANMRHKTLKNTNKPKTNIANLTIFVFFKSTKTTEKTEIEKNSSAIFAILKLDN